MLKRCLGYEYEETTQEIRSDGNGQVIEKHVKKTKRHIPPDIGAIQTWLSNRNNKKWKRNPDLGSDNNRSKETIDFEFEDIPDAIESKD